MRKYERITDGINPYTMNKIDEDFTYIYKVINDQGEEILSSEAIERATNDWLIQNDFKPKSAVATFSELPTEPELKELRGVTDENAIYVWNGTEWVLQSNINFDGLNDVKIKFDNSFKNVKEFGVVGDGVTDDSDALEAALQSQSNLKFEDLKIRITRSLLQSYSGRKKVKWQGYGAEFIFDSTEHSGEMIRITGKGVKFDFSGLAFDGQFKCNRTLSFTNQLTAYNEDEYSDIKLYDCIFRNIKRMGGLGNGDALHIRGAYNEVLIDGVEVSEGILGAGEGVQGTVGVSGITSYHYDENAFVKNFILKNSLIKGIKSEDLNYQYDQDGIRVFGPHADLLNNEHLNQRMFVENTKFINCYGRSIKSQSFVNNIKDCNFYRDEGLNSKKGNGEISIQHGTGIISGNNFDYRNGFHGGNCIGFSVREGYEDMFGMINDCYVYADSQTVIDNIISTYSSGGFIKGVNIKSVILEGKAINFMTSMGNGDNQRINIDSCSVGEILVDSNNEKSFVKVMASGGTSPYKQYFSISNCLNMGGDDVSILRSNIDGYAAQSYITQYNNQGFLYNDTEEVGNTGLKNTKEIRVSRIAPDQEELTRTGYFGINSYILPPNEKTVIPITDYFASIIHLVLDKGSMNAFAIFSKAGQYHKSISLGSHFELGNTAQPTSGDFRVWSEDNSTISIFNNTPDTERVMVFKMVAR